MDFSNLKEFHCTICGKLFNSDGRCPKMLSCGHSFCLACLNKIFPFCKSCPTCRTDILFSSVDLIPVNLLIRSCVSIIDIKSGVKRKDISEYSETENPSSLDISCDAKRKKLLSVGFCNEHENFNELRCMNCEIWICSMCAILNHNKCDTLLVEDAFIEIQKKNYQIIASQLDVRKSKLAKVFKSLNAVEEKKKLSEQDIVDLKLKIEAKLDKIKDQDIEYDKLIAMIVEEKKKFAKLNEIELLAQSCSNVENIEKLLEAKARLEALSQPLKSDQEPVAQEITTVITVGTTVNIDPLSQRLKSDQEPVAQIMNMAQADVWNSGRVLIAGDSRVRRLQSSKDPQLSKNVDFVFQGGITIKDLIELVDTNLTSEHKVLVILGFLGDEIMKFCHPIADNESITLIRSRESNPSEQIIQFVKEAHSKWMALDSNRVIVWTVPYYIDYVWYNSSKMGEYEDEESLAISYDSSARFVHYIATLRRQWATFIPNVIYSQLNKVLFGERRHAVLFKSFGAISGADFKFPTKILSDGVHPSAGMARAIWKFIHLSASVVASKAKAAVTIPILMATDNSLPSTSNEIFQQGLEKKTPLKSKWKGKCVNSPKPYSTPKLRCQSHQPVHSRLVDLRSGEELEELIEEYPIGGYGNISWKASSPNINQSTSSGKSSKPSNRPGFTSWSWDYHRRVVADAKAACFTKGVVSQIYAESELADIIRQGGLKTAKEGLLIGSITAAQNQWSEKSMAKLNTPHPNAKLVQKDVVELLPIESSEEEDIDLL